MDVILKYFPHLSPKQVDQFAALEGLYQDWNNKINVISRKDIDNLYLHHVLHSLAIAKWMSFTPGSRILDLGCGGGFPGIPLSIMFPGSEFHLVDSIAKKIKVVEAIALGISVDNVIGSHRRAEALTTQYDFVVTRAVAKMPELLSWVRHKVKRRQINAVPNGLIALKGGNIYDEMKPLKKKEYFEIIPLSEIFEASFFEEKFLVYVQL